MLLEALPGYFPINVFEHVSELMSFKERQKSELQGDMSGHRE